MTGLCHHFAVFEHFLVIFYNHGNPPGFKIQVKKDEITAVRKRLNAEKNL